MITELGASAAKTSNAFDTQARAAIKLYELGLESLWSYGELQAQLASLGLRGVRRDAVAAYIGDESIYQAELYSARALRLRWPDGARESARIVPDHVDGK